MRELRAATSTRPSEMPEHHTEERSLRKALAVYASLFILQLGGYAATGVLVLLAEAYHTLSDVLVSSFLL